PRCRMRATVPTSPARVIAAPAATTTGRGEMRTTTPAGRRAGDADDRLWEPALRADRDAGRVVSPGSFGAGGAHRVVSATPASCRAAGDAGATAPRIFLAAERLRRSRRTPARTRSRIIPATATASVTSSANRVS